MNTKEALDKIKQVHGDKYKISDSWEYKNAKSDITLYCPKHGEFHKDFYRLVNMKQGCPVCSRGGIVYRKQGYWNVKEHCLEEAKKYRNKFELQRKCDGCYQGAVKNGWLEDFFDDWAKKRDNHWNSIENVLNAAKECTGARDMVRKFGGAYNSAIKNG